MLHALRAKVKRRLCSIVLPDEVQEAAVVSQAKLLADALVLQVCSYI
jgi:hypothetical protein